jgi:hypothetical protein
MALKRYARLRPLHYRQAYASRSPARNIIRFVCQNPSNFLASFYFVLSSAASSVPSMASSWL